MPCPFPFPLAAGGLSSSPPRDKKIAERRSLRSVSSRFFVAPPPLRALVRHHPPPPKQGGLLGIPMERRVPPLFFCRLVDDTPLLSLCAWYTSSSYVQTSFPFLRVRTASFLLLHEELQEGSKCTRVSFPSPPPPREGLRHLFFFLS